MITNTFKVLLSIHKDLLELELDRWWINTRDVIGNLLSHAEGRFFGCTRQMHKHAVGVAVDYLRKDVQTTK